MALTIRGGPSGGRAPANGTARLTEDGSSRSRRASTSPAATGAPSLTRARRTPAAGVTSGMSIFITSISAYGSSAATWAPSSTSHLTSLPAVTAMSVDGSFSSSRRHIFWPIWSRVPSAVSWAWTMWADPSSWTRSPPSVRPPITSGRATTSTAAPPTETRYWPGPCGLTRASYLTLSTMMLSAIGSTVIGAGVWPIFSCST